MPGLSRRIAALLCTFALGTGCDEDKASKQPAATAQSVRPPQVLPLEYPPLLSSLKWQAVQGTADLGVPSGCRLKLPVKVAETGGGRMHFLAATTASDEILVAADRTGDGRVDEAGIVPAAGGPVRRLPWLELDAPPVFARSEKGWIAVLTQGESTERRAVLWREGGAPEFLVAGDNLEVYDAACAGERCAVLTTLAATVAGSGASVSVGTPSGPASAWTTLHIRPGGKNHWGPGSILGLDAEAVHVGLRDARSLRVWTLRGSKLAPGAHIQTGPVAYDAIMTRSPVSAHAGERVVLPCRKHGFKVGLRSNPGRWFVEAPAPPDSATLRAIGDGLLLVWLGPASCRQPEPRIVHGALLKGDGEPASSVMAISYGSGFALSTRGKTAHLWVQRDGRIVAAEFECSTAGAIAPAPRAAGAPLPRAAAPSATPSSAAAKASN